MNCWLQQTSEGYAAAFTSLLLPTAEETVTRVKIRTTDLKCSDLISVGILENLQISSANSSAHAVCMDMTTSRSWRREGGSGKLRHPSLHRSGSTTGSGDQKPLLDLETQKHVHFAEGTVSGSHLDMLPTLHNDEDEDERQSETCCGGGYVKSMVYGGLDAVVMCFALVASVSGGSYSSASVLVLGCANLIADGLSMGFGDYLSSRTQQAYAANRKEISDWEFRNNMQEQVMNLVNIYESYGMERNDAEEVVEIFAKYNDMLTLDQMKMENGLLPPNEEESPPKNGLVTFFSFLLFGSTPILSFAVLNPITEDIHVKFLVTCFVTALALILLGIAKAKISGERYMSSIFLVLSNAGVAALAAYLISYGLQKLSGSE